MPTDIMSQGQIHNPESIGNEIKTIMKEIKGSRRNVVSSITSQRSVHRVMRIPSVQDNLLEETIQRKAKQEFAIPIEETDIHWRILSKDSEGITLYVLAVPQLITDQLVVALKAAKIKPRLVDIKPLALQRLVNKPTTVIVNLESYSLGVIIVINNIPLLVRSVPLETGDLSPEAKVDLLSQELNRTVKYYNESNKNNRLPEDTVIHLTGELFEKSHLDARLEEATDLAARLQTRSPYSVQYPTGPFPMPEDFSPATYAVNLGLATKSR
jgi:hypothetical protein